MPKPTERAAGRGPRGELGIWTILKGMNAGFRYETVSETEHGKTCFDRLTDDIVEFVRVGMCFVETSRIPRQNPHPGHH